MKDAFLSVQTVGTLQILKFHKSEECYHDERLFDYCTSCDSRKHLYLENDQCRCKDGYYLTNQICAECNGNFSYS